MGSPQLRPEQFHLHQGYQSCSETYYSPFFTLLPGHFWYLPHGQGYLDFPPLLVWLGAAVFLIVGFWRLFHLSR
jgi:asparagine N-glycosylation enzyme membrane subunit Stt3